MKKINSLLYKKVAWGVVALLAMVERAHATRLVWTEACDIVWGVSEYVVESRSSLDEPWTQIGTVPATPCSLESGSDSNQTFSFPITLTGSSGFFRVGTVMKPYRGPGCPSDCCSSTTSGSSCESGSESGSGGDVSFTQEED